MELFQLYDLYTNSGYGQDAGWKSSEGVVTVEYPDYFAYRSSSHPHPTIRIWSYVFAGEYDREVVFDSVEEAIRWVRRQKKELLADIARFDAGDV